MQLRRTQKEAQVDERIRERRVAEPRDVDAVLAAVSEAEQREREPSPRHEPLGGRMSIVDAGSSFEGTVKSEHDLRVEGRVSGQISCGGVLTVERGAHVKATVEAREVVVRGTLDGDVTSAGRVFVAASAELSGTVKAARLVVEEGAKIRAQLEVAGSEEPTAALGRSEALREASEPSEDAPKPAEFPTRPQGRSRAAPSFSLVSADER